jgi:hypothetical protein
MTKFSGIIGMNRGVVEAPPGVFLPAIEEIEVVGDMITLGARWQSSQMNASISAKHILSMIVPESEVIEFSEAVYIVWQGRKWSITSIEYEQPRIKLTMGQLYNG